MLIDDVSKRLVIYINHKSTVRGYNHCIISHGEHVIIHFVIGFSQGVVQIMSHNVKVIILKDFAVYNRLYGVYFPKAV